MQIRFLRSYLIVSGLLASFGANAATNLVQNGGFETGDFTDWTTNAVSFPMYIVTSPVEEGTYAAQIAGFSFGPDTLSQTIATTSGDTYTLSFWRYQQNVGPSTFLDVTWDGTAVFSENLLGRGYNVPYQHFTASVVGTGSDTLVFTSANDPGFTYVDNVSVSSGVPEPSTWAMMLLGFAGLGLTGYRHTKRKVDVAFSAG